MKRRFEIFRKYTIFAVLFSEMIVRKRKNVLSNKPL
jgi:hypothetical protein